MISLRSILLNILGSSYVFTALRILIGIIFICASWDKMLNPKDFADIIQNYRILPAALINPAAVILPCIEAVCGILLITNIYTRGSVLIIDIMMIVFIFLFIFNIYRGLDISCGCFTTSANIKKGSQIMHIARDLLILVPGIIILFHLKKQVQHD